MFKALCATSDRNMCLFMVSCVILKLFKIWLSKELKSKLCRLEKTFKIIKPNCSRKTKQPFFGLIMVWNALMRMWFTLCIPVMLYTHLVLWSLSIIPTIQIQTTLTYCGFLVLVWLVHIYELLRNCTFSDSSLGKETYVKFIITTWCGKCFTLFVHLLQSDCGTMRTSCWSVYD